MPVGRRAVAPLAHALPPRGGVRDGRGARAAARATRPRARSTSTRTPGSRTSSATCCSRWCSTRSSPPRPACSTSVTSRAACTTSSCAVTRTCSATSRPTRASAVVANWEQIKKAERSSSSLVDSISPGLPSLLYAHKLYRKAASVGLEPDPERDGFAVMRDASTGSRPATGPVEAEAALGDLLAGAVVAARARGVDAESSLRGWAGRFRDRFVRMEQLAAAAGIGAERRRRGRVSPHVGRERGEHDELRDPGRTVTIPVEVRRARSWFASFAVPADARRRDRRARRARPRRRCRAAGRCSRSRSCATTTATSTRTARSRSRSSSPTRSSRRTRVRTSTGCRSTRSSPARPAATSGASPSSSRRSRSTRSCAPTARSSPSTVAWRSPSRSGAACPRRCARPRSTRSRSATACCAARRGSCAARSRGCGSAARGSSSAPARSPTSCGRSDCPKRAL